MKLSRRKIGVAQGALAMATATFLSVSASHARVVSFRVSSEEPAFEGHTFGSVGSYVILKGVATFEVDPKDPLNANIVDIQRAPKNSKGMVSFETEVAIVRPLDPGRGNHRFILEPQNRGINYILADFNNSMGPTGFTTARMAGNGFLMREGYSIVSIGWQPRYAGRPGGFGGGPAFGSLPDDAAGMLYARLPVARNDDGSPITGETFE